MKTCKGPSGRRITVPVLKVPIDLAVKKTHTHTEEHKHNTRDAMQSCAEGADCSGKEEKRVSGWSKKVCDKGWTSSGSHKVTWADWARRRSSKLRKLKGDFEGPEETCRLARRDFQYGNPLRELSNVLPEPNDGETFPVLVSLTVAGKSLRTRGTREQMHMKCVEAMFIKHLQYTRYRVIGVMMASTELFARSVCLLIPCRRVWSPRGQWDSGPPHGRHR